MSTPTMQCIVRKDSHIQHSHRVYKLELIVDLSALLNQDNTSPARTTGELEKMGERMTIGTECPLTQEIDVQQIVR